MLVIELNRRAPIYLSQQWFKSIAHAFMSVAGRKSRCYVSLVLVNSRTIQILNRNYRHKNKVTDVLSFAEEDDGFIEGNNSSDYLGEIVICVSRARSQAMEYGYSLKQEVARLLIHGLAHLIGYNHENVTAKEAAKMFAFERKVSDYCHEHKL